VDLSDQRRPADGLERFVVPPSTRDKHDTSCGIRAKSSFELAREANAFRQAIESRGGL
jgi:hypothetical protein